MPKYLFDTTILVFIYFLFFFKRWKGKENFALKTLRYLYICAVLAVTLMPFVFPIFKGNNLYWQSVNWIPFVDIIESHQGAVREVLLNVLMLIPYGFLTTLMRNITWEMIIRQSFMFSLAIEFVQLLYCRAGILNSRTFDVTDLITNTMGGLIGWMICQSVKKCIRRKR